MAQRVASVIFGLCSLVALLTGAFAVYIFYVSGHELQPMIVVGLVACIVWGLGRLTKYVIIGQ